MVSLWFSYGFPMVSPWFSHYNLHFPRGLPIIHRSMDGQFASANGDRGLEVSVFHVASMGTTGDPHDLRTTPLVGDSWNYSWYMS